MHENIPVLVIPVLVIPVLVILVLVILVLVIPAKAGIHFGSRVQYGDGFPSPIGVEDDVPSRE